jgi:hypothetical protein
LAQKDEALKQFYLDRLAKLKYDPHCIPPKDHAVFSVQDRTVGSLGNFIAFTGPPKEGKSLFLAGALASSGIPGDIWGMKLALPEGRGLIQQYDTEQSLYQFHSRMNLAKDMMGRDFLPKNISSFLMRGLGADEMLQMIEYGIAYNREVSVVFIDGLLDLCNNYNSEVESIKVSSWLKRVTRQYDILIIAVIHVTKRDKFSLGHLGASVDRFGQSILRVEKDESKKFITMSPVYLKDSIDEFKPVTIMHDGERFVKADMAFTALEKKKDVPPEGVPITEHKYMVSISVSNEGSTHKEVIERLAEMKGFTKVRCKAFFRYWFEHNLIERQADGLYVKSKEAKLFISK